jgi:hypothetical protein
MPAKQVKRRKQPRKLRKTSLPTGPSLQKHYQGPQRSQVDLEQHLLLRPSVAKPVSELPTSIDQIKGKMKRMPEDLKGIFHIDGRITIPLDAKHRATNWREVLLFLEKLGASKEEIDRLSEETEHRIIQRLKRAGRIIEASKRDEIGDPRTSIRGAGTSFQELSASPEKEEERNSLPQIPADVTPIEVTSENRLSNSGTDLGSLSVRELFELARGISGQIDKRGGDDTQRSRSEIVKAFAKAWAQGICQFCGNPAQYRDTDGTPRLHVHHITFRSDDGEDCIENVVAVCPNCHDIIHVRKDRSDTALLRARAQDQISRLIKKDE